MEIVEYLGISRELAAAIEGKRESPNELKVDILDRILIPKENDVELSGSTSSNWYSIGQGAQLKVGEKLFLFLNQESRQLGKPQGITIVGQDGIYFQDGKRVPKSRGSQITPAMHRFQIEHGHTKKGKPVSLSAWRQWHVFRGNKFIRLYDLKDPSLAKHRTNKTIDPIIERFAAQINLSDLGL